ncbi:oligosaccharide flippase family protein [Candidatus Bathyarchaeota archaeon]|nr:oligosaccharide flippase family protein [Candidatus Bathyarchaeota archaeon]
MNYKADASRTVKGTLGFVIQSSATSLLGLVLFAVFARFVSKGEMGAYAGLTFTVTIMQLSGVLGLNTAAARFTAKLLAEGERAEASGVARIILTVAALSGCFFSLLHYFSAPYFSYLMSQSYEYTGFFQAASVIILIYVPLLVIEGLVQGVQEYWRLAMLRVIGQIFRILVCLWLFTSGWGVYGMIVGWSLLGIIMLLGSILVLRYHLDFKAGKYGLKPILKYSVPVMGAGLATYLSNSIDLFIVMSYGLPEELGAYNVALAASGALSTILVASATATLLPATSAVYGVANVDGVGKVFFKASRYLALLFTPASFGLASLAWPVILIMGGASYRESTAPLTIIGITFLIYSLSTPITTSLTAIGETRKFLMITLASVVVGSTVAALSYPVCGIIGAALGRACLSICTLTFGFHQARKVFSPRFDLEALAKSLLASIIMAFTVYVVTSNLSSILSMPIGVMVGVTIYVMMLRFTRAVKDEDLRVLSGAISSKAWRFSEPIMDLTSIILTGRRDSWRIQTGKESS